MPPSRRVRVRAPGLFLVLAALAAAPRVAPAQQPVVHAVMFFSPTCPHCERVIQNVLPSIFAHFGGTPQFHPGTVGHLLTNGQLEILLVDATQPEGGLLYRISTVAQHVAEEQQGVPRLVCGDSVLVGEFDIPDRFPGIVTAGLARGGIAWPAIAELAAAFPPGYAPTATGAAGPAAQPPAAASPGAATTRPAQPALPAAAPSAAPADSSRAAQPEGVGAAAALVAQSAGSPFQRTLRTDPIGGSLALAILALMLLSVVLALTRAAGRVPPAWIRAVPVVAVAGMVVAAYLAYVEATGTAAVCGPIGDCNAVQQSVYARVAGIPVAVLGLVGYVAILAAWLGSRLGSPATRRWAAVTAFALSVLGTIASAVLTALEPLAIGAVCTWCLTSAVLMTALLWLLARPAREAAVTLRSPPPHP